MADFLASAGDAIPNLVGMKFTAPELHEFQQCLALQSGRFEVIWGTDEMLLAAWAVGAQAAIGSTYNVAAPLYRQLISAFQAGDLVTARECQLRSIHLIAVLKQFPFFAGLKQIITARGIEMGGCLPPNASLTSAQKDQLASALAKIGFEV
jgi:N-acetylneuraminate lyase